MPPPALAFVEHSLSVLEQSVNNHDGDLRNVQLATVSPEGRPNVRTLVLRGFDRSSACAEMHTDARAAKVRDMAHCSHVTLLAWSASDHLQIRLAGTAELHRADDIARARWDKLSPAARKPYGLLAEAGSPIEDPGTQSHLPPESQFGQFVVVVVSLTSLDILLLGPEGSQTRASGRFTAAGITAGWIGA